MNQLFIRELIIDEAIHNFEEYPFNLSFLRTFDKITFNNKVTFFIGENGCGKSTLLEAIAVNFGFNPEGGSKHFNFATANTHSILYDHISLVKGYKSPKDGFFLRAESFYNVASQIDKSQAELQGLLASYGDISLHEQSHGESFISLISNRFRGNGLYILDEPEAALSPQRQLTLLSLIGDLVHRNSQFIIATHSPILMAFPDAQIYVLDNGIVEKNYKDTEHYMITQQFLNNPNIFLKHLID